jgi:hypothetical protein|tara:strand:- start:803 stop:979 length:177 start_codon:yes stop_codon:yes gene_type:complete
MLAVYSKELRKAFGDVVWELSLSKLKIYDLNRKVLFATFAKEIGSVKNGDALNNPIKN